jgi:transcriptional regulator with XRE-family HTH domain
MTGRQLRNLRKKLAWTQAHASRECGVALRTWARWEAGEHRIPASVVRLLALEAKRKR